MKTIPCNKPRFSYPIDPKPIPIGYVYKGHYYISFIIGLPTDPRDCKLETYEAAVELTERYFSILTEIITELVIPHIEARNKKLKIKTSTTSKKISFVTKRFAAATVEEYTTPLPNPNKCLIFITREPLTVSVGKLETRKMDRFERDCYMRG